MPGPRSKTLNRNPPRKFLTHDQWVKRVGAEKDAHNPTLADPGRRRTVGRLREAEAVEPNDAGLLRTVAIGASRTAGGAG
jgi:hypothetical protein